MRPNDKRVKLFVSDREYEIENNINRWLATWPDGRWLNAIEWGMTHDPQGGYWFSALVVYGLSADELDEGERDRAAAAAFDRALTAVLSRWGWSTLDRDAEGRSWNAVANDLAADGAAINADTDDVADMLRIRRGARPDLDGIDDVQLLRDAEILASWLVV